VSEKDDDEAGGGVPEGAVPATATEAAEELDGVPKREADIPATRRHESQRDLKRPSAMPSRDAAPIDQLAQPTTFPDDGPVSAGVRKLDYYLGIAEQALLFGILVIVVLVASTHAIKEKLTHLGLWWSADVIRGGTFTLAMVGAAYATQQQRHLAMDLISKKISPRYRLLLASAIELFTIVICAMLMYSGYRQLGAVGVETGDHLIQAKQIVVFLPVGAGLIALHAFLHLIIHLDYFARGKVPPERARSGH
jgi:TRAP-type C4-dicarboxylate transport system permease small subunit